MKRIIVNVTEEQYEFIREESHRQKISISELIRRYIPLKSGSFKKEVEYTMRKDKDVEDTKDFPTLDLSKGYNPIPKLKKGG